MNKQKNLTTKRDVTCVLGLGKQGIVINPGVPVKDVINLCLNTVLALTQGNSDDDVVRLFNAALASRNPELVFGTKEELQAELEAENKEIERLSSELVENESLESEIAELREKVKADVEAAM